MPPNLQARVLSHLARYRLTTNPVLTRLYFSDAKNDEARKSVIKQLTKRGDIGSARLYAEGPEVFYYLTPTGAVHVGHPESFGGVVKDVVRPFARLLFCCGEPGPGRPRFTADEFDRAFPGMRPEGSDLFKDFPSHAYYLDIDAAGVRRLGRILDVTGKFELAPVHKAVQYAEDTLPALVADNRFALALVTTTKPKADEIKNALAKTPPAGRKHLHYIVEDYEALLPLVVLRAEQRAKRA